MTIREVIGILEKFPDKDAEFISIDDHGFINTTNILINEIPVEFAPYEIQEYRKVHPHKKIKCTFCGSTHLRFSYTSEYGNVYQCDDCDDCFTFSELV